MIDLVLNMEAEDDKKRLYEILKGLKGLNVVQIKKYRKGRTLNQNKYLFGVIYRYLGHEIGYTVEECHQLMKVRFLSYQNGIHTFTRSTTDLDTAEMTEYIDQIRTFALEEFSCYIPEASEVIY